ncbi:hypothetical protein [Parachitinimonas caeni]|uniref:Uncharacterized protein n=1 Tax=Parachitinimonas caeni TaxID=3031301 RepID=A0ABT7E2R2_9NEIS|nr:hypothetical protein [Parachitinimonas caeni]MDK2126607.1 hypothetical protein [Parachitinimonas caeni]
MKALFLTLALAASSVLAADITAGSYNVQGKNPNGSPYKGTLKISGKGVYKVNWSVGSNYSGIGLDMGNLFAVGWGKGKCGAALYKIEGGKLSGEWVDPSVPKRGSEQGSGGDFKGNYPIKGKSPDGGSYEGTISIEPRGAVYKLGWKGEESYNGVGVRQGNMLAVGWGGENCGVVVYEVKADGGMSGSWAVYGENNLGSEELSKGW